MTTSAHNKRRFHGSTEEPSALACLDRDKFSLRTLQPWLYADIPSSKRPKPRKRLKKGGIAKDGLS